MGSSSSAIFICRAELAIVVADDVFGFLPIGRGFSKLLSNPELRWMSSDVEVNDPPRMQFDDKEDIEMPKDKVDHRHEITRAEVFDMRFEEGGPGLARYTRR